MEAEMEKESQKAALPSRKKQGKEEEPGKKQDMSGEKAAIQKNGTKAKPQPNRMERSWDQEEPAGEEEDYIVGEQLGCRAEDGDEDETRKQT